MFSNKFYILLVFSILISFLFFLRLHCEKQKINDFYYLYKDKYNYFSILENKTLEYYEEGYKINSERNKIFPFYLYKLIQKYNYDIEYFIRFFSVENNCFLIDNTHLFNKINATNYDYVYTPAVIGGFYLFHSKKLVGFSNEIKQSDTSYLEAQLKNNIVNTND